jgi:hypothetical protein
VSNATVAKSLLPRLILPIASVMGGTRRRPGAPGRNLSYQRLVADLQPIGPTVAGSVSKQ